MKSTRSWLGALVAFAVLAWPTVAQADAVIDWNVIASDSIVVRAAQPPATSALGFAMVHGAIYDAVNAIDQVRYQPYLVAPAANPWDSKEAATATAAFRVLVGVYPTQLQVLQPIYDEYVAALPDVPAGSKAAGIAVGAAAADAMLAARANDGRGGPAPTLYPVGPGVWRPTPPNFTSDPTPWLGNVLPFIVPDAEMLRTDGPNPLSSAAYAEDFNEVKDLGSRTSTVRTPDQTEAAIWWQGNGAFWNAVTRRIVASNAALDTVQLARLFAMENTAAADGFIGCYNDKYYWQFWRPIAAIRAADTDGNPATESDPSWTPAACDSAVPRPSIRPQLREQRHRAHDAELLRHRQGVVQRVQHSHRNVALVQPFVRRTQRGHRRPRLGRHSLPHRRRAGGGARQESGALARQALLPADKVNLLG
jgi:hypothetical protein